MLTLVIGNYNYSSWSLRAWLQLRASRIEFEVERVPLFSDGWRDRVAQRSPAGRVPVLLDGTFAVWDTMAILEYVIDTQPGAIGWPGDLQARARARSVSAEMHSGFVAVRNELPQNVRHRKTLSRDHLSTACQDQLQRIDDIWSTCRGKHAGAGPWLFGELSVADFVFAPVALRLVTYGIPMSSRAEEFVAAVQAFAPIREWEELAEAEMESLPFIDDLRPIGDTPLTPG